MVLRKTWVLGNIGSDIESVFDGSRSLVFLRFLRLEVSKFLPMGLGVSDLSFYLSFWSQESNFSELIGTAYRTEPVD